MFYYRVISSGQWCGAAMSHAQDDDWRARYEAALSLASDTIEEVESENDPRTGPLLVEPPPVAVVEAELEAIDAILAKPDADITAAERGALALRMARRLRNRRAL